MITRIYTEDDEKYVNIIELLRILIVTEFIVSMEYIKVFDNETRTVNIRRIFWYTIVAIPSLAFILIIAIASIKFIAS